MVLFTFMKCPVDCIARKSSYRFLSEYCNNLCAIRYQKYPLCNNHLSNSKKHQCNFSTTPLLLKRPATAKNWKFLARDGKRPDKEDANRKCEEGTDAIEHSFLVSKLQNCSSVSEQIETFTSILSLTPEDLEKRTTFCKSLDEVFKIYFPKFKTCQFGSSVNGLGFKGCDLDMCIQTNFEDEEYVTLKDVPTLRDVREGLVPSETVARMTPKYMLRFVRRILHEHCPDVRPPMILVEARCPVLRIYDSKYDVFCDFSCESKNSLRNTMLLRLLGHLDERFVTLAKIIRYWGKYGKFVGDLERFNSYSFSLLVVYFLQTRNPPILPSIGEVCSKSEYIQRIVLEDTDLLFGDLKKFSPSKNSKTVEELLKEFFFHFLTYDFTRVMAPAKSSSVHLADLVPDKDSDEKFIVNTVSVQDPFRPNFNATGAASFSSCKRFLNSLLQGCEVYQNESFHVPKPEPWGLSSLFIAPQSESEIHRSWQENRFHLVELPAVPDAPSKIRKILEHGLLFDCFDRNPQTDQNTNTKVLLKVLCKVNYNTWLGRDWVAEKYRNCEDLLPLELEHLISKELIANSDDRGRALCVFECECMELVKGDETKLTVHLNFKEPRPPVLAIFLKEFISNMLRQL